jgi:hypothetical protein
MTREMAAAAAERTPEQVTLARLTEDAQIIPEVASSGIQVEVIVDCDARRGERVCNHREDERSGGCPP